MMTPLCDRQGRRNRRGYVPRSLLASLASLALIIVLSLLLLEDPQPAGAKNLVLYCAAGIMKPVEDAAAEYKEEFGVSVQIEPAGSGELLNRLEIAKGRAHLYLAADSSIVDSFVQNELSIFFKTCHGG